MRLTGDTVRLRRELRLCERFERFLDRDRRECDRDGDRDDRLDLERLRRLIG